jgi:uncharacterized membrane protein YphA (DoxX/SURF4 family)
MAIEDRHMEDSSAKGRATGYWVATALTALLFAVPGAALLLSVPHFTEDMAKLGYPHYFLTILGVAKILGVIAILMPGLPRLKEWAYAGMFFDTVCAVISRVVMGESAIKVIPPLVVGGVALLSWRLRPEGRLLNCSVDSEHPAKRALI